MPVSLVDDLAEWRSLRAAFETLWLDSAEFEDWARQHLLDPSSPPNARGLDVARKLSAHRLSYMAWFEDLGVDEVPPLTACPRCGGPLEQEGQGRVCRACLIAVFD
jgi:hypothetical protein